MSFLKNILKKEGTVNSYTGFWNWFAKHDRNFYSIVKTHKNIEKGFFDKVSPKLAELKEGLYLLTGMLDDHTAELVITADGNIGNIVFIEDLVSEAPVMDGWKFTALKPALDIKDVNISMGGYEFNRENLFFYSNDHPEYPDEIDISIVHTALDDENRPQLNNGVYIFLDNYLGELDFLNHIDSISVVCKKEAEKDLIPIDKLKDFLKWRQKEFIEKYEGVRYDTEHDEHSILEAELENGNMLVAVINTQLLNWDRKASHPWIATLLFSYDGSNNAGFPADKDIETLNKIEEDIMTQLTDKDGYLNIGRETSGNERKIYFACKDFREPSRVFYEVKKKYEKQFNPDYEIYKDKYWQSFEKFQDA